MSTKTCNDASGVYQTLPVRNWRLVHGLGCARWVHTLALQEFRYLASAGPLLRWGDREKALRESLVHPADVVWEHVPYTFDVPKVKY